MVHHVQSSEEYDKLKASDNLVVVDFSAEWCGPCKRIAPVFEEYSKTYSDVVFIHVDIDAVKVPDSSDVSGVPTFKFFKGGKLVHQFSGASAETLKQSIEKYK